ncbi:hypothetical protein ENKNEFLB_00777 [Nocardioides aquaticus]|uniref:Uncharacterized protein n=1 Tax=Nocardioides aquaticus TaxID=160826 RepID=A0ABX8EET7_9ACTN|nr:hypothetical protein [Nocardioides aquaticus]QVT78400.1 hypothetical protein ENKNEFLB_00777 [Nocardioides aquaticus]
MTAAAAFAAAPWSARTRGAIFYVVCVGLLVVTMAKLLTYVLPGGLAAQLGNYGESVLYAVIVAATIQVARRHRPPTSRSWLVAGAFAVVCVGLAIALRQSTLPPGVRTLTEPLVAGGLTALYVNLRRPVRWPLAWSAVVVTVVLVFFDTEIVLEQSEAFGFLVLAPICLDIVDRSILDPVQPDRPARRLAWCASLAVLAAVALLAAYAVRPDLSGPVEHGIDYLHRAAEAYWGWILIHLYLGFWLPGRLGLPGRPGHR